MEDDASFNMSMPNEQEGQPMNQDPMDTQMPIPENPEMGNEIPEDETPKDPKVKEISEIGEELSDKDKQTLLKYARSLKDQANSKAEDDNGEESEMQQGQLMMESFKFTKGQLRMLENMQ